MHLPRAVANILSTQELRSADENLLIDSSVGCVSCLMVIAILFVFVSSSISGFSDPRLGANGLSLNSRCENGYRRCND